MDVFEFQDKYLDNESRKKALKELKNDELDEIIKSCGTAQGKIFYSYFKKDKNKNT